MQAQSKAFFSRNIYGDFTRFMLASLAAGVTAAVLLSSAVVALSSHVPGSGDASITSDKGQRVRVPSAGLPSTEAAND